MAKYVRAKTLDAHVSFERSLAGVRGERRAAIGPLWRSIPKSPNRVEARQPLD